MTDLSHDVRVTVLLPGQPYEAALVAALAHPSSGVKVERRCVSVTELVSLADTSAGLTILISAAAGIDRALVGHLSARGHLVVGLAAAEDDVEALRRSGIQTVLTVDVHDLGTVVAQLAEGVARPVARSAHAQSAVVQSQRSTGRVVGVWGPPGAPGRTSVAIGLADEASACGVSTLLIDADPGSASIGALLGIVDDLSGFAAATRHASTGRLDATGLIASARGVSDDLGILTGVSRRHRWSEIQAAAMPALTDVSRQAFTLTVIDLGAVLDDVGLTVLDELDALVVVAAAEPLSLSRLVVDVDALTSTRVDLPVEVVITKVRARAVNGDPRAEVAAALADHAGLRPDAYIPCDWDAYADAVREARTLREIAPQSPARKALSDWALAHVGRLGLATRPVQRRVRLPRLRLRGA